jgi:hypothetical protein
MYKSNVITDTQILKLADRDRDSVSLARDVPVADGRNLKLLPEIVHDEQTQETN